MQHWVLPIERLLPLDIYAAFSLITMSFLWIFKIFCFLFSNYWIGTQLNNLIYLNWWAATSFLTWARKISSRNPLSSYKSCTSVTHSQRDLNSQFHQKKWKKKDQLVTTTSSVAAECVIHFTPVCKVDKLSFIYKQKNGIYSNPSPSPSSSIPTQSLKKICMHVLLVARGKISLSWAWKVKIVVFFLECY